LSNGFLTTGDNRYNVPICGCWNLCPMSSSSWAQLSARQIVDWTTPEKTQLATLDNASKCISAQTFGTLLSSLRQL